jgi:hypothetical protein
MDMSRLDRKLKNLPTFLTAFTLNQRWSST